MNDTQKKQILAVMLNCLSAAGLAPKSVRGRAFQVAYMSGVCQTLQAMFPTPDGSLSKSIPPDWAIVLMTGRDFV